MPFHPDALTRPVLKSLAHALQKAAPDVLGHPIAQHQAQELLARQLGYAHWHEAYARASSRGIMEGAPSPAMATSTSHPTSDMTYPWDLMNKWPTTRLSLQTRASLYVDEPARPSCVLDAWMQDVAQQVLEGHAHQIWLEVTPHGNLIFKDDGLPLMDRVVHLEKRMDADPKRRTIPIITQGASEETRTMTTAMATVAEALTHPTWSLPLALFPASELQFIDHGARYAVQVEQEEWTARALHPSSNQPLDHWASTQLIVKCGEHLAPDGQAWLSKSKVADLQRMAAVYAQLVPGFVITVATPGHTMTHHRVSGHPLNAGASLRALEAWGLHRPSKNQSLVQAALERSDRALIQAWEAMPRHAAIRELMNDLMPSKKRAKLHNKQNRQR